MSDQEDKRLGSGGEIEEVDKKPKTWISDGGMCCLETIGCLLVSGCGFLIFFAIGTAFLSKLF